MSNILDASGLQIKTREEIITSLSDGFKLIYGTDINLDSDSPDGQMINLIAQVIVDNAELTEQVYSSFNPDNAIGVTLDQRAALNGIQRQAGTYSEQYVTVTVSKAMTLYGLDQPSQTTYTVSDNEGTQWQLMVTKVFSGAGNDSLLFRAKNSGKVLATQNTITKQSTILLGVVSVNNPLVQSVVGQDEETDQELRLRRQKSVSISSQGYLSSLLATLENISGITSAFVFENNTGAVDSDGIPDHSIWVIVGGSYADIDVADAIYKKRNAGCGMKGSNTYTITQLDGSDFIVKWDDVTLVDIWVELNISKLDGITAIDTAAILAQLPTLYSPNVYEQVNSNKLSTYVQQIDPNALVNSGRFCLTEFGTYTNTLAPATKDQQFLITSAKIKITVV